MLGAASGLQQYLQPGDMMGLAPAVMSAEDSRAAVWADIDLDGDSDNGHSIIPT